MLQYLKVWFGEGTRAAGGDDMSCGYGVRLLAI